MTLMMSSETCNSLSSSLFNKCTNPPVGTEEGLYDSPKSSAHSVNVEDIVHNLNSNGSLNDGSEQFVSFSALLRKADVYLSCSVLIVRAKIS